MKITDILTEMTSAGAIATVAQPMGKMIRRNKKQKTNENEPDRGKPAAEVFPNLDPRKDTYKGHLLQDVLAHVYQTFPDGRRGEWRKLLTKLQVMPSISEFNLYKHHFNMLDKAVDSLETEIKHRPEIDKKHAEQRAEKLRKHKERIKAAKEKAEKEKANERKLSKSEIKQRDKYADDLPDAEFKKRYGKDWEAVKYGTATNMAKKKTKESVQLDEYRSTNILGFISGLRQHPEVEKIVDIVAQADGKTALVRTKDGNAYEVMVRQAGYNQHPSLDKYTKK